MSLNCVVMKYSDSRKDIGLWAVFPRKTGLRAIPPMFRVVFRRLDYDDFIVVHNLY